MFKRPSAFFAGCLFVVASLTFDAFCQSPGGDIVDVAKANQPDTIKILMLGNSFTFMWNTPDILKALAQKSPNPKKIYTHLLGWGGATLTGYWGRIEKQETTGNFESLLKATDWDYVVLQRWGNDDVAEIVPKFAEMIHAQNPKTKILLYAWGGAGKMEDAAKPPEKVQAAHETAAAKAGATIVPVCWAWYRFRTEKPGEKDVADDGWHPGAVRSYMTACSLYAAIFHESPVGIPVYEWTTWAPPESKGKGRVTKEEAAYLQGLAWDSVREHSNDPFFTASRAPALPLVPVAVAPPGSTPPPVSPGK